MLVEQEGTRIDEFRALVVECLACGRNLLALPLKERSDFLFRDSITRCGWALQSDEPKGAVSPKGLSVSALECFDHLVFATEPDPQPLQETVESLTISP
jgi:hypothetical protein